MLSLQHQNVVKAYHYCTFAYSEPSHSAAGSRGNKSWSGNQRPSMSDSQSSGGSRRQGGAMVDSAQRLSGGTLQQRQPNSANSNSGSGSSARVLLLRRQAQAQARDPVATLAREDSSDVLVTNLSFDAQGVQEAAAIAGSLLAESSVTTKGSDDTKQNSRPSEDDQGLLGAGEAAATKDKAETWLVSGGTGRVSSSSAVRMGLHELAKTACRLLSHVGFCGALERPQQALLTYPHVVYYLPFPPAYAQHWTVLQLMYSLVA